MTLALEECCLRSLERGVRERHDWVRHEPHEPDAGRLLDYDAGVLIYADTGDPVYPYPYTPLAGPVLACRQCGRTRPAL